MEEWTVDKLQPKNTPRSYSVAHTSQVVLEKN